MTVNVGWIYLFGSGLIDVAWAISMKKAAGSAHYGWTLVSLGLLALFVFLLTRALQVLPLGTAYAVWTGIGAVGTVVAGILLFDEPVTSARLLLIGLIVAGIVGLKLS
jgi:quaternary ammonium compound-resistance protein SugE